MEHGCSLSEAPASTDGAAPPFDVEAIIERNVELFRDGEASRTIKYPEIRAVYQDLSLVSTFSHLNPNLSIDEVYGNYVLREVARRLDLDPEGVLNVAYDNIHPGHDAPKAHRIQYVIVNVNVLDPEQVIHRQAGFAYDAAVVEKDGQNRVKSAPEQNIERFRERFDEIDEIYRRHSGEGRVAERLIAIRADLFSLLGLEVIPERPFSEALSHRVGQVLEHLYKRGLPFWEMPIPAHRDRYVDHTFLVEGIDESGRRQATRFEGGAFLFRDGGQIRSIPAPKIFEAITQRQVVPTMPLVILATATAPQMPHLGGRVWREYAPVHVEAQAKWLGIDETSRTLILSTEGHKPLLTYRYNQEFSGFPAIYLTYGRERMLKALADGSQSRVEFKRTVF